MLPLPPPMLSLPSTAPSGPPACQPAPSYLYKPNAESTDGMASDDSDTETPEDERAKWHCCNCFHRRDIHIFNKDHIIGALACVCPHKPCETCGLSGIVKPFEPIEEPAIVPVSPENNEIWFGVVCPCCGLSWRAKELRRHSKLLKKMPSFSMAQHHQKRLLGPADGGKLRRVRSTLTLTNKRNITPPGPVKQAEFAAVSFGGFECTCGHAINDAAMRFQVTGPPTKRVQVSSGPKARKSWWTTRPELKNLGHGKPQLEIQGTKHANPLRSCPIKPEEVLEERRLVHEASEYPQRR